MFNCYLLPCCDSCRGSSKSRFCLRIGEVKLKGRYHGNLNIPNKRFSNFRRKGMVMDGGHVHHLGPLHRPVQACGRFSSVCPVQGVGPGFSCLVVEVEPVPHLNQPTRRSKVMWRYIYIYDDRSGSVAFRFWVFCKLCGFCSPQSNGMSTTTPLFSIRIRSWFVVSDLVSS